MTNSDNAFIDPINTLATLALKTARGYSSGERGSSFDTLYKAHNQLALALRRAAADYEAAIN